MRIYIPKEICKYVYFLFNGEKISIVNIARKIRRFFTIF